MVAVVLVFEARGGVDEEAALVWVGVGERVWVGGWVGVGGRVSIYG